MKFKKLASDFAINFIIVLVVSIIVTYLYSFIVHSSGVIDWETSFRLALIFGIVIPLANKRK
jgi:hypothetical protein